MPPLNFSPTIIVDTREKTPFDFYKLSYVNKKKINVERGTLKTGDYSIRGLELDEAVVERKSLSDLVACVGRERRRFEAELERMLGFKCRAVVVEASWDALMLGQWQSRLKPSQVVGSVIGWQALGIPFFFHRSRDVCANFTLSLLLIHARRHFRSQDLGGEAN